MFMRFWTIFSLGAPDGHTLEYLPRSHACRFNWLQKWISIFKWCTSTGSGLFELFGRDFDQIVSIRVKTLSYANMIASRRSKREKGTFPVDLRRSKTSLFKLPSVGEGEHTGSQEVLSVVSAEFDKYFRPCSCFTSCTNPCYRWTLGNRIFKFLTLKTLGRMGTSFGISGIVNWTSFGQ